MDLDELVKSIADALKDLDAECPVYRKYQPGIGPYGEPQLVKQIAARLTGVGISARTTRTQADLDVLGIWAVEFKVARPFGDNGNLAEHWSENLLHPYAGSTSLIGDALKLMEMTDYPKKCVFTIGYEHDPPQIDLTRLINAYEMLSTSLLKIPLGPRVEERRVGLVHPVHQVVRCVAWQIGDSLG